VSAVAVPIRATDATISIRLRTIGTVGALLALVIVASSMLLRLSAFHGSDGQVVSTLPPTIETFLRLVHRLAASGIGLLTLAMTLIVWRYRPLPGIWTKPIGWIVATTVALALIGPMTPGYRVSAVIVGNIFGGVLLLMSCWWLREVTVQAMPRPRQNHPLLRITVVLFLAHIATGAAASASAMHGLRGAAFIHLGTAVIATMFLGAAAWTCRHTATRPATVAASLLAAQVGLGFLLLTLPDRPLVLAFIHGVLTPLLAATLVSLACRSSGQPVSRPALRQ
jgi:heme A synthase